MVTPKGPGRELGNGGFSYPRAELVVSLVDRMQLLPLSWEMARGATMQVHHGGPGGPSIHWKALSLLLQVTGGKTEPPAQQAGTPCRLPKALCILKRPVFYSEWGSGEGHSLGRALAGALSTRPGNRPDLPRSPMSGRRVDSVPDSTLV